MINSNLLYNLIVKFVNVVGTLIVKFEIKHTDIQKFTVVSLQG